MIFDSVEVITELLGVGIAPRNLPISTSTTNIYNK